MDRTFFWAYLRAFTDWEWEQLLPIAKCIIVQAEHGFYTEVPTPGRVEPILLAGPRGINRPYFNDYVIALNGRQPHHGGSFVLFKEPTTQKAGDQRGVLFSGTCETGGWPYGAVIVCVLAAARAIAPAAIEFRFEDGNLADRYMNLRRHLAPGR